MNDIINIKEKFKVDDSHSKIRGFVCAYDENGKLVFSKENMIVESGRRFILNNGVNEESLKYVQLGTNGTPASPLDTIDDLNENNESDPIVRTDIDLKNAIDINSSNFEVVSIDSESVLSGVDELNSNSAGITVKKNELDWVWSSNNENILEREIPIRNGDKIVDYQGTEYTWNGTDFVSGFVKLTLKTGTEIKYNELIYRGGDKFYQIFSLINGTKINYNDTLYVYDSNTKSFKKEVEGNFFSYFIDQEQLVINCFICFNGKESIAAKSLGIIAKYPSTSTAVDSEGNSLADTEVLFSRVTFPTYYKSNHQRLTFKYYIYF